MKNIENNSLIDKAVLNWIFEFAAQGFLVTDAALNIYSCNKWFERYSGKDTGKLIKHNLFEVFPELKIRGFDGYYDDALGGQSRILSHRLHKYLLAMPPVIPDTPLAQMQQSARIFPLLDAPQQKVIGTITIIEDVTERVVREMELNVQIEERERLLKSELAARRLAEENSRLKDQFLATVSHEIRTPLNSISGWTQILLTSRLDEKKSRHALETIRRSAASQTQIIEDLLDISRIITGQMRLELQPVNLVESIEAALDISRPAAVTKGIILTGAFESRITPIMGDASRLQQIFGNLLSNAIKFTPAGGQIEVTLHEIDELAEITVRDTGYGIPADFLPFVFERFRQADGSSKRKYGGLGLGLSIVKNLVEMHGGTISVESTTAENTDEAAGTAFTIKLPLAHLQNDDPALEESLKDRDKALSADISGFRILIVDDVEDSRELLKFALEDSNANIMTAADVPDALAKFAEFQPNILISDLGMPDMDGYDLIKLVRAQPAEKGGQIPAIALTGYVSAEEQKRVQAAGFNFHLPKPVDISELIILVNELLHKSKK